jgi:hypothetical protein
MERKEGKCKRVASISIVSTQIHKFIGINDPFGYLHNNVKLMAFSGQGSP